MAFSSEIYKNCKKIRTLISIFIEANKTYRDCKWTP